MTRPKSDPPPTLSEAIKALNNQCSDCSLSVSNLQKEIGAKRHDAALEAWKIGHDSVLKLKDAYNRLYRHLAELKPAPVKKPPRAEKAPKAERAERADKRRGKTPPEDEPEVTDQGDDAPEDYDEDDVLGS